MMTNLALRGFAMLGALVLVGACSGESDPNPGNAQKPDPRPTSGRDASALPSTPESETPGTSPPKGDASTTTPVADSGTTVTPVADSGTTVTPVADAQADSPAAASGACVNPTDAKFTRAQQEAQEVKVATPCFGDGKCITQEMVKFGLTPGCAACWGDVAQCGKDNCLTQCIAGATSAGCRQCTKDKGCDAKFTACAGI